jgi:hypothetical protein
MPQWSHRFWSSPRKSVAKASYRYREILLGGRRDQTWRRLGAVLKEAGVRAEQLLRRSPEQVREANGARVSIPAWRVPWEVRPYAMLQERATYYHSHALRERIRAEYGPASTLTRAEQQRGWRAGPSKPVGSWDATSSPITSCSCASSAVI